MPPIIESSQKNLHNTWIEINTANLHSNLRNIRTRQGPSTRIMAVVKANAYGHGLGEIARRLDGHVDYLGVSSLNEALEIKKQALTTPVFLFARLLNHEVEEALKENITLSVSSLEEASRISEISLKMKKKTAVHVKVDTGMGRLGLPFSLALKSIERMNPLEGIFLEGIYTHFPTAEREDGFTDRQFRDFVLLLQALEKKGILFQWRHGSNSAGSVKIQSPVFNMIRPGLMLYGIYPDLSLRHLLEIFPVLSLKSRIVSLKRYQPGQTIGYGREYVLNRPATIGLLPLGYSHGYPFRASNRGCAIYQGKYIPVAGRVSMDYLALDFGNHAAQIGDAVTLIGHETGAQITAEDLAAWAGTIPYEIVTRLIPGIPRIYI